MKLFLLSLCCVVVLATTSAADVERKEELEKVLDELSNALVAEEAKTEGLLGKGNVTACVQWNKCTSYGGDWMCWLPSACVIHSPLHHQFILLLLQVTKAMERAKQWIATETLNWRNLWTA